MPRRNLAHLLLAIFASATLVASPLAQAQAQDKGVSTFQLSSYEVDAALMSKLQVTLDEALAEDTTRRGQAPTEMTLNDMVLTMGCPEVNEECLSSVSDYIEADQFIYGSVQRTDDIYLVNLGLFDLQEGVFIRRLEDRTIEGDEARVVEVFGMLVENLLYGDVGTLVVRATPGSTVSLDGEELGEAPGTFEGLALGEHIVAVTDSRGRTKEQKVVLGRQGPAQVTADFDGQLSEEQDSGYSATQSSYFIPGWVSVGVGVLGVGFGLYQRGVAQRENDTLTEPRFERAAQGPFPALPQDSAQDFRDAVDARDQANTLSVVGLSVGAVALAAGGVMLYTAYTSEPEDQEEGGGLSDLSVGAGLGNVQLSFSF